MVASMSGTGVVQMRFRVEEHKLGTEEPFTPRVFDGPFLPLRNPVYLFPGGGEPQFAQTGSDRQPDPISGVRLGPTNGV